MRPSKDIARELRALAPSDERLTVMADELMTAGEFEVAIDALLSATEKHSVPVDPAFEAEARAAVYERTAYARSRSLPGKAEAYQIVKVLRCYAAAHEPEPFAPESARAAVDAGEPELALASYMDVFDSLPQSPVPESIATEARTIAQSYIAARLAS